MDREVGRPHNFVGLESRRYNNSESKGSVLGRGLSVHLRADVSYTDLVQRQPEQSESSPPHACEGIFATTHWSVVLEAGREDLPEARGALETLCRAYWYPLYAFVRRRGYDPEAARDFTQEFFYRLLTSDWIARADRTKGRFRTFLLCGMQNLLANEWQKANRLKRGAGRELVPLDGLEAEGRYKVEPTDLASADKLFERRWALTLLDRVLARLQSEQEELMAAERFESLRGVLLGEPSDEGYATLAHRFGVTESTVKSWVHRLRRRYRELLHEEVAQTVSSPEEVQDELRHLFRVLAA